MKLSNTIRCLRQLWQSQQDSSPPIPAEELLLRDGGQIRQLLNGLARSRRGVVLQAPDGSLMATGDLQTYGEQGLAVRIHEDCLMSPSGQTRDSPLSCALAGRGMVNISAASESGVLMFSLHGARLLGNWLVAAQLPTELIRMQSRRHFRLSGRAGQLQNASISWPGSPRPLALQDLSEEGAGLVLMAREWKGASQLKQVTLVLGQDALPVPLLQVVHERPLLASAAPYSTIGARLIGIKPEHIRSLRRWLIATQAEMCLPQLDLADQS
ncbi:PilZ domain-containing protein [Roseateles albus]|uniref:PilZ domain-containing protein n=1 Tax=Roseateles albus TaxID=2987525 RepID=A0ABT5KGC8_9BURK|nr:hypothetical protein [Roseateles albus]MDC8772972.1 hypothetical protein [Roseateles albus]